MQPPPQGGGMPMTQGAPPPQRPPERPPPTQGGMQAVTKKVGDMTLQQQQYKVRRLRMCKIIRIHTYI